MRLLLDMHVLLWWGLGDPRLAGTALAALVDPANELYLSSVSGFEVAAKVAIGKLKLPAPVDMFIGDTLRLARVVELPLVLRHAYRTTTLPLLHRDPFDRPLVGVAVEEGLTLMTDDSTIKKYPVGAFW